MPALPLAINKHVKNHGKDAAAYVNHQGTAHAVLETVDGEETGNAFVSRYQWTTWRQSQAEQCQVLLLFGHLFWFDLVQIIHPQGNGRVGNTMREQLAELLHDILPDEQNGGLVLETVTDNISTWSLRGRKINQLYQLFGPNLLFLLNKQLSNDL